MPSTNELFFEPKAKHTVQNNDFPSNVSQNLLVPSALKKTFLQLKNVCETGCRG